MTILVALRLPRQGAVIASDSRTAAADGRIWSDDVQKIVRFPNITIAVAGDLAVLSRLKRQKIQTQGDVRTFIEASDGLDFTLISYDRIRDRLWIMEDSGGELECPNTAVIGSGAAFAAGALQGHPTPKTLQQANKIVRQAIRAACNLHVECGGKTRSVVCGAYKPMHK